MKQHKPASIDAAKDQFVFEWESGNRPTLEQYVDAYPQFAEELAEFIIGFVHLSSSDPADEHVEESELQTVSSAIGRGMSAGFSQARSLKDRISELGSTYDDFYGELDVTEDFIAAFQRQPVENVPHSFWHRAALALNDTLSRAQSFLSPKKLAFRSGEAPQATSVEFSQLLSRVHSAHGLSDSQFEFWLREANKDE